MLKCFQVVVFCWIKWNEIPTSSCCFLHKNDIKWHWNASLPISLHFKWTLCNFSVQLSSSRFVYLLDEFQGKADFNSMIQNEIVKRIKSALIKMTVGTSFGNLAWHSLILHWYLGSWKPRWQGQRGNRITSQGFQGGKGKMVPFQFLWNQRKLSESCCLVHFTLSLFLQLSLSLSLFLCLSLSLSLALVLAVWCGFQSLEPAWWQICSHVEHSSQELRGQMWRKPTRQEDGGISMPSGPPGPKREPRGSCLVMPNIALNREEKATRFWAKVVMCQKTSKISALQTQRLKRVGHVATKRTSFLSLYKKLMTFWINFVSFVCTPMERLPH